MKIRALSLRKQIPYYLLVLFVVLIVFIVVPAGRDIITLRDDIQSEREKLEESYAKGLSLRKTKTQLAEIQRDVDQIEQSILNPGQELFLITALEDIAGRKNLEQEIIMDDLPPTVNGLTRLPLRVELSGRFSDVLFYIAETEQLDFYINWQSVTMRSKNTRRSSVPVANRAPDGATDDTANEINVVLQGETYWKP